MTPAAYAVVDLDAVKHNLAQVRQFAPNAKVMAVIKANAYGHGLINVAQALGDVDGIAVARLAEGIELRKSGITCRITVLEGFVCEQELDELLQFNLEAVVHSVGQVDILEGFTAQGHLSIWMKLDSGMNRLGFKADQFLSVYQRLIKTKHVKQPIAFMSHFSTADEINSRVTQQQIKLFSGLVSRYPGEQTLANSAAIIACPNSIKDWVRPGIMLYGVSPFADSIGIDIGLKPVMSFHARVISVKMIKAGEFVGYSGTWCSKADTRLGVVAIGYGDGYPRSAKSGTPVLVNGKRVPLVGRVSMDMITVDLTSQPDSKPGDKVTLWGEGLPVEVIAKFSETIPYTLLCGVTQRVRVNNICSQ